jgi:hypothetical protein
MDTPSQSQETGEKPPMMSATNESHKSAEAMAASEIYIDPEKEKAIIRKFDFLVLPQFVIILILAYLDRSNIGRLHPQEQRALQLTASRQCAHLRLRGRHWPQRE